MRTNSFSARLILFSLAFPLLIQAQQSRLRQSVTRLSAQIARKMDANHRTRIAVMDFSDLDGNTSVFGKYLAETLITDLFDSGKFQVVERRLLVKVLEENKLKSTGLIDPATVKKLGQVLGADAIVSGTITDLANHVAVNARLVATDTAAVFASASEEIEKDEDVRSILQSPVPDASKQARPPVSSLPITEQKDEFQFAVKGCVRQGEIVTCRVAVTNRADQPRSFELLFGPNLTTLVDDNGDAYVSEEPLSGNGTQLDRGIASGGAANVAKLVGIFPQTPLRQRHTLMPDLPMNFAMRFRGVSAKAKLVNINLVYSTGNNSSSVLLRDIPLDTR